jgi:hypothetical protein
MLDRLFTAVERQCTSCVETVSFLLKIVYCVGINNSTTIGFKQPFQEFFTGFYTNRAVIIASYKARFYPLYPALIKEISYLKKGS